MARISLNAQVLKQKDYELYLFGMNSKAVRDISYVTPRSKETPEEVQRLLSPKRAKEIGTYIREQTSILPNAIVVSLTSDVEIRRTGRSNEVTIEFPQDTGKYMYILDGQHRVEGFKHSEGIEFDLPIVALYQADEHLRGKVFADINSKQVKVTNEHLLSLYYQIRELPSEEFATMDVVKLLAEDIDSPLRERIKMLDDQSGTWVSNRLVKQCLSPHTESGGVLFGRTTAAQAKIMKEYLKGVSQTWPKAWGNNREFMLTKPMGIEIMFGIFANVKHRCDLNEGRQYTADSFTRQLKVLDGFQVILPGGGEIELDWMRGRFGTLSNATGRSLINKQLTNALRQADETEEVD
jgi:DGQHR domain-containing protein